MSASLLGYLQTMATELARMARDVGYVKLANIYDMAAAAAEPAQARQVSIDGGHRLFVGLWDWDGINERMYFDEATAEYYGIDPAAAANGLTDGIFRSRIHAEDAPHVHEAATTALTTTGHFSAEFRVVDAKDYVRWVYQKGRVQRDARGRAVRFNGVMFDITGEKCALLEAARH